MSRKFRALSLHGPTPTVKLSESKTCAKISGTMVVLYDHKDSCVIIPRSLYKSSRLRCNLCICYVLTLYSVQFLRERDTSARAFLYDVVIHAEYGDKGSKAGQRD